ncbi:hypothetical protein ACFC0H_00315, partial [Streptomyces niveus]
MQRQSTTSPLLSLPGAVAAEGQDEGVAAHYGDLFPEQRALADGKGLVDLSHRGGGGGGRRGRTTRGGREGEHTTTTHPRTPPPPPP